MRSELPKPEGLSPESQLQARWFERTMSLRHQNAIDSLQAQTGIPQEGYRVPFVTIAQAIEDTTNPYLTPDQRHDAGVMLRGRLDNVSQEEEELLQQGVEHWIRSGANPLGKKDRSAKLTQAREVISRLTALMPDHNPVWGQSLEVVETLLADTKKRARNRFNRPEHIEDAQTIIGFLEELKVKIPRPPQEDI